MPKAKHKQKQKELSIYMDGNGNYLFLSRDNSEITITHRNKRQSSYDKISQARQIPRDKGMKKIQSWKQKTSRRKKTKYKKHPDTMKRVFRMQNGRYVILKLTDKIIDFSLVPQDYFDNQNSKPMLHFDKEASSKKEAVKIFHYLQNKLKKLGLETTKQNFGS